MIRLINLELQKLWLNRTSRVLIFISFILPFTVLVLSSIKINFFGFFTLELGELGIFNFPIIWHITTFFASYFKFFFAIVVVSMIGNEYSNKTLKQNLIDGLSKKEFILSKFYTIVFFLACSNDFNWNRHFFDWIILQQLHRSSHHFQGSRFLTCLFC
jgi:ABC-2 type transport system permease protein